MYVTLFRDTWYSYDYHSYLDIYSLNPSLVSQHSSNKNIIQPEKLSASPPVLSHQGEETSLAQEISQASTEGGEIIFTEITIRKQLTL